MGKTDKTFQKYKWISLLAFAGMYCFVYLGRFNVDNLIEQIALDVQMTVQQQELISISVFISYALGSFLNGYMADLFGAKKIIVTGGVATCLLNMSLSLQNTWAAIFAISLVNGYFQSMIWVGGISLLANWWREGERGKGIGIANFFSGISHVAAYTVPSVILSLIPSFGWRATFILPIILLFLLVILFGIIAVERPENKGLKPYVSRLERHRKRESILRELYEEGKTPWKYFLTQPRILCWCGIAMLSSICRYGLLNWIPLYFRNNDSGGILSETFSNLTLPIGMAAGTLVITWIAGNMMFNNKGLMIIGAAAMCGTLVIIFPMLADTQSVLIAIFFTGFTLYGLNGILWIHAIDQGCRVFAGSMAGLFNGCAYLGACIEGVLFPAVLKVFGSYISIFIAMEVLCLLMVVLGVIVSKKDTIVEPEVRE